jgi:hypothetical protein
MLKNSTDVLAADGNERFVRGRRHLAQTKLEQDVSSMFIQRCLLNKSLKVKFRQRNVLLFQKANFWQKYSALCTYGNIVIQSRALLSEEETSRKINPSTLTIKVLSCKTFNLD